MMNESLLAVIVFVIALLITWGLGPLFIPLLYRLRFGQEVRQDGPRTHLRKQGTPTMGGVLILGGIGAACLFAAGANPEILLLLGIMFGCGLLGFLDDFLKVVLKRPLGLKARMKIIGQLLLGSMLAWGSWFLGKGTFICLPFSNTCWDLGFYYYFLVIIILIATTNAVNLTDGLDGLASGLTVIASLAFLWASWKCGDIAAVIFAAAMTGSCCGFLRYNYHPARIFMGDTGSLAIGGGLAALAVLTGNEVFLFMVGGVFVLETLSVIIQVLSFRLTGKRVFRMSPLHHHFELKGWTELKVVHSFWLLGFLLAVFAVYSSQYF